MAEWPTGAGEGEASEPPPPTSAESNGYGTANLNGSGNVNGSVPPDLVAIWRRMCSPRGVIEEFARLKEAITQAAGAEGETGYGEILKRHGVENSSQFKSSQPARLCAKELFQAIQNFQHDPAAKSAIEVAQAPVPEVQRNAEVQEGTNKMPTELVPAPQRVLTLYEVEDNLAALANTFDLVEEAEARQMILAEIGRALRQAQDKRDAVVGFLRHCEAQQRFADQEIERIKNRRDRIGRLQDELEQYVVRVIDQFVGCRPARSEAAGRKLLEHPHSEESGLSGDHRREDTAASAEGMRC